MMHTSVFFDFELEMTNKRSEVFHRSGNLKCSQYKISHIAEHFLPQTRGFKAATGGTLSFAHQVLLEQHKSATLMPSLQKPA